MPPPRASIRAATCWPPGAGLAAGAIASAAHAQAPAGDDPTSGLYPAMRNMRYRVEREMTEERIATTYNNFYEFGTSKTIWQAAQKLPIRPWQVKIEGLVENPRTVDVDDIFKAMKLEERVYRFRCVEAWAMTVPWSGFPLASFVEWCKPLSAAKYVQMETFNNPAVAPGQRATWYPWPYTEGPDDRRGDQRARLHRHGHLRQADPAPARRTACA